MYTNQYRDVFSTFGLGFRAVKAAATLPGATSQDIFTVRVGRVFVTLLIGEVTVQVGAGATPDLSVTSTPTTGTATVLASDVVIASDEVGTLYIVEGDGTALVPISSGYVHMPGSGFVLPIGTVSIATTETTAGATKWDIWYFPLDEGAYVASA